MTSEELFQLYLKEREYQTKIFGDFRDNKSLNLASFLLFLESYLKKAIACYSDKWTEVKPDWLLQCEELQTEDTAPILTYENLIKVFALAGAALETFTVVDAEYWRKDGVKKKWLDGKEIANE
jgi:hypothetical protein